MGGTDPAAARRPGPACCIVNRLTAIQSEAARIIFDLSEADGFALAGGSALVALGIVDRTTRDIDAFVAARRTTPPGDVGPLATAIEAALTERGWTVTVVRRHVTFTRLLATIRDETIEIDLAVDSPLIFPIEHVDGLPTLSPQDLAARKVLAILDRAEGRDFTDLWALALRFSRPECVRWAKQLDSGVADEDIARAFGRLARLDDNELPCIESERPTIRNRFAEWATELEGNPS